MFNNIEKWKEYSVEELFEVVSVKNKLSRKDLVENGTIPVYSSTTINNGIEGYYDGKAEFIITDDIPVYVVFGDHTKSMDIVTESFCVMDNVKVLIPKFSNIELLQFICTIWQKKIPNLGYSRHWSIAQKTKIPLPTDNSNNIEFGLINKFMSEQKNKCQKNIEKLSSIWNDTNKIDTNEWKRFKIIDLFEVNNTHSILKTSIIEDSGIDPYVTASKENNGVYTYVDYDKNQIEEGNAILIGGKTLVITYQERDFYSNDSHNLVLYLKEKSARTKNIQLFLVTALRKSIEHLYSWGDSISNTSIQKDSIMLPVTTDGTPDWNYMNDYIEKLDYWKI